MIQRLQTIFLILAGIAFVALFQFPFAVSDISDTGFLADKDLDVYDSPILIALAGLGGLIAFVAVFLFKNRPLQIKLSYLTLLLGILLLVVATVLFYNEAYPLFEKSQINGSIGLYMPFLSFVFGVLAARFISKDEKLVRSADRLR